MPRVTANMSRITKTRKKQLALMMERIMNNLSEKFRIMLEHSLDYDLTGSWERDQSWLRFFNWYCLPAYTVSYMIDGDVRIDLRQNNAEPKTSRWRSGDVLLLPPSVTRRKEMVSKRIHCVGVAITYHVLRHIDPLALFELPIKYSGKNADAIASAITNIIALKRSSSSLWSEIATRKINCLSIFHQLIERGVLTSRSILKLNDIERITPALSYLDANTPEEPDYDRVAQLCGLSKSRFRAVFKDVMGQAPGRYALEIRLKKAANLLLASSRDISEIAIECGWSDPFHFSRIFKRAYCVSPKMYRNVARLRI